MRGVFGWTFLVSFVAACASGPARPAPERAEPAPTPPPPATAAPAPAPVASAPGDHTVLRDDVLDILDRGIPWFLRQIDTEPELDRGRFVGFRLTAFFANDTRFRAVDLVPGDVVQRVNGLPIERPEHAYRIWQELRVASEIRVEYLRGGHPRQIDYTIVDGGS
jgi:S1-C subfamily serine protease